MSDSTEKPLKEKCRATHSALGMRGVRLAGFSDFDGLWATGVSPSCPARVFRAEEGPLPGRGAGGGGRAWPAVGIGPRRAPGWALGWRGRGGPSRPSQAGPKKSEHHSRWKTSSVYNPPAPVDLQARIPRPDSLPVACTSHLASQPESHLLSLLCRLSVRLTAEPISQFILNLVGGAGEQETIPSGPNSVPLWTPEGGGAFRETEGSRRNPGMRFQLHPTRSSAPNPLWGLGRGIHGWVRPRFFFSLLCDALTRESLPSQGLGFLRDGKAHGAVSHPPPQPCQSCPSRPQPCLTQANTCPAWPPAGTPGGAGAPASPRDRSEQPCPAVHGNPKNRSPLALRHVPDKASCALTPLWAVSVITSPRQPGSCFSCVHTNSPNPQPTSRRRGQPLQEAVSGGGPRPAGRGDR